jgi:hypothetical protein
MRVIHVAPTALGASGLFGGGERYPIEPAPAPAGSAVSNPSSGQPHPAASPCLAAYRGVVT